MAGSGLFVARVDLALVAERVAIEYGGAWHWEPGLETTRDASPSRRARYGFFGVGAGRSPKGTSRGNAGTASTA